MKRLLFLLLLVTPIMTWAQTYDTLYVANDDSTDLFFYEKVHGDFKTFMENSRVGVKHKDGRVIVKPEYESIDFCDNEGFEHFATFIAPETEMRGLVNLKTGRTLLEPKYARIFFGEADCAEIVVEEDDRRLNGLYNLATERIVLEPKFKKIEFSFTEGTSFTNMYACNDGDHWGVVQSDGKTILPCVYKHAYDYYDFVGLLKADEDRLDRITNRTVEVKYDSIFVAKDYYLVCEHGKWGASDFKLNEIIPCMYDAIGTFSLDENLAVATLNGKSGYIDRQNKVVLPFAYDKACNFSEGLAAVFKDGKWSFIDINGQQKASISGEHEFVLPLEGGFACVFGKNGKYGVIDKNGQIVVPHKYNSIGTFRDNLAEVFLGTSPSDFKMGLIDNTGKEVLPCKYDMIGLFEEHGLAEIRIGEMFSGKSGLIDKTGKIVLPCEYNSIGLFYGEMAYVQKGEKYGYIDSKGRLVVPCEYDEAESFYSSDVARVQKNGKYGFIDKTGKLVIPCIYDEANDSWGETIEVTKNGEDFRIDHKGERVEFYSGYQVGKYYLIDEGGLYGVGHDNYHPIIKPKYDNVKISEVEGYEDWAVVEKNELRGLVSLKDGSEFLKPEYSDIQVLPSGCARVVKDELCGLVSLKTGRFIFDPKFEEINVTANKDVYEAQINGKWGKLLSNGKMLLPFVYDYDYRGLYNAYGDDTDELTGQTVEVKYETVSTMIDDYMLCVRDDKYGMIDINLKEFIPCVYDYLGSFSKEEGLAIAGQDYMRGFINRQNKVIVPFEYDKASYYQEGLVAVCKDDKWSLLDTSARVVATLSEEYYQIYAFVDGFAKTEKDGMYGFIDKTGKEVVSCKYSNIDDFKNGFAIVNDDDYKCGIIDSNGNEIVPCGTYDHIGDFENGLARVNKDEKYGLVDTTGRLIIPCIYDYVFTYISYDGELVISVEKDGEFFDLDKDGKRKSE